MSKKVCGRDEINSFIINCYKELAADDKDNLVVIGIKTRGEFLGQRLVEIFKDKESKNIPFGTLDITLYRDDFKNKKNWPSLKKTDIPHDIENKKVVLVDDVIYTGRTVRAAINSLMDFGRPSEIKLFVLVDRGGRELPIHPDLTGIIAKVKSSEKVNVYISEIDNKDEVVISKTDAI